MSEQNRRWKVIEALAHGHTARAAAAVGGVDERTVRRWREEPEFNDAVNTRAAQLAAELSEEWLVLERTARATLIDVMNNSLDDASRVRAAKEGLVASSRRVQREMPTSIHVHEEASSTDTVRERLVEIRRNLEAAKELDIPQTWTEADKAGHRQPGPPTPTPAEAAELARRNEEDDDTPDLPEAV